MWAIPILTMKKRMQTKVSFTVTRGAKNKFFQDVRLLFFGFNSFFVVLDFSF